jgi:hypothetical protein
MGISHPGSQQGILALVFLSWDISAAIYQRLVALRPGSGGAPSNGSTLNEGLKSRYLYV